MDLSIPAALVLLSTAAAAADDGPVKTLGTVTVTGTRPTSLPTQIPTTIEGVTGVEIADRINASDSEDALKYFPSLLVRKRYIGDYDHAVLASRASGTGNSARSLVYADGILLSNLVGNGATYTPRWGMVTPEEIERVDVLYGPFSAAYPGNSVGAVVDYVTRMPEHFEAHTRMSTFGEDFEVYGTRDTFTGWQASASLGNRSGDWSWWLNYNRLDSDSHPIGFANRLIGAGRPGAGGTAVTGAFADKDPRNRDWLLLGATSQIHTLQDHAKAKLAYDISPTLHVNYTLGWWQNDASRRSESYLQDAAGNPVYGGTVNIDGREYALNAADFAPSRGDLRHLMHGLSVKSTGKDAWDWEVAASLYDYDKDIVRSATEFLPVADSGGEGRIADQHGTGWNTLALKATWRPQGWNGAHLVDLGYQRDNHRLRTRVSGTRNWIHGPAREPLSAFRGETVLQGLYLQDTWRFAPKWSTTFGIRVEDWQALDGALSDTADQPLPFPERSATYVSPKAAIAYQLTPQWALKASLGRAVRTPTVAELYQGTIATDVIVNNDPNLAPEKSWTSELTAERELRNGSMRATLFHEDTRDALYSQVNTAAGLLVATIQNVEHIRTSGVEMAYQAKGIVRPGLDLSSSLTYARSRIVANANFPASVGKWQPRVPEWRANLLASYRLAESWTTTVGARYSGRQYNQLDNSDPNGASYLGISDFCVVDARMRYRVSESVTAALGVDNVNNEKYWAFHPYSQRTYTAELHVDF
jgi:iron complex outermembrane receptor protein